MPTKRLLERAKHASVGVSLAQRRGRRRRRGGHAGAARGHPHRHGRSLSASRRDRIVVDTIALSRCVAACFVFVVRVAMSAGAVVCLFPCGLSFRGPAASPQCTLIDGAAGAMDDPGIHTQHQHVPRACTAPSLCCALRYVVRRAVVWGMAVNMMPCTGPQESVSSAPCSSSSPAQCFVPPSPCPSGGGPCGASRSGMWPYEDRVMSPPQQLAALRALGAALGCRARISLCVGTSELESLCQLLCARASPRS